MADLRGQVQATINFLKRRKAAYMQAKSQPAVQAMLQDLAKFCRANETAWRLDPREHALLEGRRQVWLRIEQHLHLSPSELLAIYAGDQFRVMEIEE